MLFAIDGIEMSGKTTQVSAVTHALRLKGHNVIGTHEIIGTRLGYRLRHLIEGSEEDRLDPLAKLYLISAARAQHLKEVVRPHLKDGKIVVMEGSPLRMLAYQGYGERYLDLKKVWELCGDAFGVLRDFPTRIFFLDVSFQEMLRRQQRLCAEEPGSGYSVPEYVEISGFYGRVWRGYSWALSKENSVFRSEIVKGEQPPEQITHHLVKRIESIVRGVD